MNKCEFEYEGRRCGCAETVGIARCKYLCKTHFNTVVRDNIRRFNKGKEIPKELIFTKKLRPSDIRPDLMSIEKEVEENGNESGNYQC